MWYVVKFTFTKVFLLLKSSICETLSNYDLLVGHSVVFCPISVVRFGEIWNGSDPYFQIVSPLAKMTSSINILAGLHVIKKQSNA